MDIWESGKDSKQGCKHRGVKNMEEKAKNYKKLAQDIIRLVGGQDNILSAARCATRLRFVLKNIPEQAEENIKALSGVITVVEKQGQLQIVIGNHVGDVFEEVSVELGLEQNTENEELSKEKESLLNRLLQMMSGVFTPVCYVLAAGGLLQGILILLTMAMPEVAGTGTYQVFNFISWTPFTFLPVLLAISASKHFRCNPYIAAACCLALVNPTWTEMAGRIAEGESIRFLFTNLTEITYTSSVLPPLILIVLLSKMEKFLNKHLPEMIRGLFTPFICLAVLVPLTIVVIGPIIQGLSNGIAAGYNFLYEIAPPIAGAVVGGLWQVIVIFGVHWGMVPIVIANFAENGQDTLQIFIQIAVISQMAAAFGVFLKSKDRELKTNALSSGITGIFGITEPAIYGITLPRKKPFVFGCIWAAIGSAVAALLGATQYVYAGLPGLISVVNSMSAENPNSFTACMIGVVITIVGTIASILLLGCDSEEKGRTKEELPEKVDMETEKTAQTIYSPLTGEIKSLKEVNDPTFSEEILGKGVAILPTEGVVYAPFDGEVSSIFETKHAIGLTSNNGTELLIHVGLETVNLGGKYFETHISQGDQVKKGDKLISFELQEIKKTYDTITPVIIANSDDFSEISVQKTSGKIRAGEAILMVRK